jgi:hypothetical protein
MASAQGNLALLGGGELIGELFLFESLLGSESSASIGNMALMAFLTASLQAAACMDVTTQQNRGLPNRMHPVKQSNHFSITCKQ